MMKIKGLSTDPRNIYQRNQKKQKGSTKQDYVIMFATLVRNCISKKGGPGATFDYDTIRAIMEAQNFTDPISKQKFLLPTSDNVKSYKRPLWHPWVKTLTKEQQACTPHPVKIDRNKPWSIENIMFISKRWVSLYEDLGGMEEFLTAVKVVYDTPPIRPTLENIINNRNRYRTWEAYKKDVIKE